MKCVVKHGWGWHVVSVTFLKNVMYKEILDCSVSTCYYQVQIRVATEFIKKLFITRTFSNDQKTATAYNTIRYDWFFRKDELGNYVVAVE